MFGSSNNEIIKLGNAENNPTDTISDIAWFPNNS